MSLDKPSLSSAEHSAPPTAHTPEVLPRVRRFGLGVALAVCLTCGRFGLRLPHIAWAVVWRSVLITWLVLSATFLLVRYVALPQVAEHRLEIAAELSRYLGVKVEIDTLQAQWNGFRPELLMSGVRLFDKQGREALSLPRVDLALAWSSIWHAQPELYRMRIQRPELAMRRELDGTVFIAGIALQASGAEDSSRLSEFILSQHEIRIDDARVTWHDQRRGAKLLAFDRLSLQLQNKGSVHRFAIAATPAGGLSGPIDLRGDLRGDNLQQLSDWRGTVYLDIEGADLAVWRQWVDYPLSLPQGRGALRTWLNFEGTRIGGLTADLALSDVQVRFAAGLPMLALNALSGRVRVMARDDDFSFAAERLALTTREGLQIGPTQFALRRFGVMPVIDVGASEPVAASHKSGGEFSAEKLDMRVLSQLAAYLPFPQNIRERLESVDPQGVVSAIKAKWEDVAVLGDQSNNPSPVLSAEGTSVPLPATRQVSHFDIDAKFDKLTLKPSDSTPGFSNISGRIKGTEAKGEFSVDVQDGALALPSVMHEAHIALASAEAAGSWQRDTAGVVTVRVPKLAFANADASGAEFSAEWHSGPQAAGTLDMTGRVQRFQANSAWRYIPTVVPVETSEWLKSSLTSGTGDNIRVRLVGDLSKFPFQGEPKGQFRVEGKFGGVDLNFAPGWPVLEAMTGELLFDRTRMLIRSHSGKYRQAKLGEVTAELADLERVRELPLVINGRASGPGGDILNYVQASPVANVIGPFIQGMRLEGEGALDIKISVPLLEAEKTRVQGTYRLDNSVFTLTSALPPFKQVRGVLGFSENGIGPTQATAEFLGGAISASGRTASDGAIQFDANGLMPAVGLKQLLDTPALAQVSGQAQANARVTIANGRADVLVTSALQGIRSTLPAPLNKSADARQPFSFAWSTYDDPNKRTDTLQDWHFALDGRGAAQWQERCGKELCSFVRGAVALNDSISLPARGLRLSGKFQTLDLDQWRPILFATLDSATTASDILAGGVLQADEVVAGGHRFKNVLARAVQQGEHWVLRLEGPDVAGDLTWASGSSAKSASSNARLVANLSNLSLHPVPVTASTQVAGVPQQEDRLPALDIKAENFELRDMKLGKLTLHARDEGAVWRLAELRIESPDGVITGDGTSRTLPSGITQTDIALDITSENAGGLLARMGFPDALRRGKVVAKGKLSWNAPPTSVDYPSMSGDVRLDATDGQFNKLDPGAGRLLGILSLQSLPRRLTLDFRDIFSDGFGFDSIRGDLHIKQGIMHTDELQVRGPAARVFIKGTTDIVRETHDLQLTVQPTLSDSIALGITILNPVVGVVTYVAQKVLRDPFEKIFSFDYTVTGSWNDPKIEKDGVPTASSAPVKSK